MNCGTFDFWRFPVPPPPLPSPSSRVLDYPGLLGSVLVIIILPGLASNYLAAYQWWSQEIIPSYPWTLACWWSYSSAWCTWCWSSGCSSMWRMTGVTCSSRTWLWVIGFLPVTIFGPEYRIKRQFSGKCWVSPKKLQQDWPTRWSWDW